MPKNPASPESKTARPAGRELKLRQSHIPDAWPGLLNREQLCAYVGLCDQTLTRILPVRPVDLGVSAVRWSRVQIDQWIDGLPPRLRAGQNSTQEKAAPADVEHDMAEQRRHEAVERVRARSKKFNSKMGVTDVNI